MSRKALILFAATSLIWGSSFLFIRVAVQDITPATVVFGRTLLGAAILVPLALRARAFRGLGSKMLVVTVVTLLDMALPTFLTAWGEQHITSSVAGILTATDPLFTAVLLSALGYAASGLLYRRWLADAPALGVTALMTAISSAIFLVPALADLPHRLPGGDSITALVVLGVVNTGIAYWLFCALIDEAGAATASVITYVMPVVALGLGVAVLGEDLTVGAVLGLILIGIGAWLATAHRPGGRSPPERSKSLGAKNLPGA